MVRVVFMGSDAIGCPTLDCLLDGLGDRVRLVGVVTGPDRPQGRGLRLAPNPVKIWAEAKAVPIRQPERPGPEDEAWMRALGAELIVVMAYGVLLKRSLLGLCRYQPLNLHTSRLPKFRGASPVAGTLAAGEPEAAVTLMQIVPKMDAGPVYGAASLEVHPDDTTGSLERKLGPVAADLLRELLPGILSGEIVPRPQDEAQASFTRRLVKSDGGLDFALPAEVLERRIRALQPWPGAWIEHGGMRLRVAEPSAVGTGVGESPGMVLGCEGSRLLLMTAKGALSLGMLQRPGGKWLQADAFLRGYPIPAGVVLASFPMQPLVSKIPF